MLHKLIQSFDDVQGLPGMTFDATRQIIDLWLGRKASQCFSTNIKAENGRYRTELKGVALVNAVYQEAGFDPIAEADCKTFEITLRGYSQAWEQDNTRLNEFADTLVKWVNAPSKEALDVFIQKHLQDSLDCQPIQIMSHEINDGVDVILDAIGNVIFPKNEDWEGGWKRSIEFVENQLTR